MNALPTRLMKSRSPRVVAMPSAPTCSISGRAIASTVMITSSPAIAAKKVAVCHVHAIQAICSMAPSYAPKREALGDVVADEPDHERAWHDGEHAGGREQSPVHAGGGDGTRHRGCDRLGVDGRERARQKEFDPREHEA